MDLTTSIREIKGIGEKTAAAFNAAGVFCVSDLLSYYPRGYETFEKPISLSEARYRDRAAVIGSFLTKPVTRYIRGKQITEGYIFDETEGKWKVTWFNMPYLSKTLATHTPYVFKGKISGGAVPHMVQPRIFSVSDYEKLRSTLRPVYSLKGGLKTGTIQKAMEKVFSADCPVPDPLPENLRNDYGLPELCAALREIHFPVTEESFSIARKRIVFEEFYRFLLDVRRLKEEKEAEPNHFFIPQRTETEQLVASLPFTLTDSQQRVLTEIREDLSGPAVMNRLVQGDVGSGKTIVAFLAMYETVLAGFQAAMMAPTAVLASQHYEKLSLLIEEHHLPVTACLLTGATKEKDRRVLYEKISSHQVDIVIGTQALFQERVHYDSLGLVVTDEQHRFGVNQRRKLAEKSHCPHVLVMSATPIPRTLAMILYGDLDISVMTDLPKNRIPIKNAVVDIGYRAKAYRFIQKEVLAGHQAYIVCPMISSDDTTELESVSDYAKNLQNAMVPGIRVDILHGQMSDSEKEEKLHLFAQNQIQVLVSTTVIEVGIDVPNATVMMVENAERFGLSELHQLRGRIGRSHLPSYAIFVDTLHTKESMERLDILAKTNDGFQISSEDLRLRGPGDLFGIRQSGEALFKMGDIYRDAEILSLAEKAVKQTTTGDFVHSPRAVL